jgi:hypothetical protein
MKKIITCAGFHGTGSSVISDLLKEYKNVKSFGEFEFRFLQDPHGVGSLEDTILRNNCRLNSDRGIYDFLRFIKKISRKKIPFIKKNEYELFFKNNFEKISREYVNNLIDLKWKGWWHDFIFRDRDLFDTIIYRIKRFIFLIYKGINLILGKKIEGGITETFYYSNKTKEEFIKITKNYLNKLFAAMEVEEENLCLDQLVPVVNLEKYLNYFENLKVIVLDRDPRDLYIINKFIYKDGVVPVENVEIFIQHFKLLRKDLKKNKDNEEVLRLNFEDCIYNYDKTLKKIVEFLDLNEEDHKDIKKFFNPEISKNNTQLYLRYPHIKKDIIEIEKQLKEYCYNFPYEIKSKKNKVF